MTAITTTGADPMRDLLGADDADERERLLRNRLACGEPDAFLAALRAESERQLRVDARDALWLADALIVAARLSERPTFAALGRMARADALLHLGRYREAVAGFEEARAAFAGSGDEIGWARTYLGWVYAQHLLGNGVEAVAAVGPAYAILARREEWLRAAGLDLNTAAVCYHLGRYDEALDRYRRAEIAYARLGDEALPRVAWARANQAEVLTLLGDFDDALALHHEALEVLARCGERVSVHRQHQFIADVHAGRGYFARALHHYAEARAGLADAGLQGDAAWAALGMADCYLGLNRLAEALALAEEAGRSFDRSGSPTEGAKAQFIAARARARQGDRARAAILLAEAARSFDSTGLANYRGLALLLRAALHLDDADWSLARDVAAEASAVFAGRGLVVRRAQADLLRARALLGLARPGDADACAREALALADDRGVPWLAGEAQHVLARAAQARGHHRRALARYESAIAAIERMQVALAPRLGETFLADKLAVYHDAIACCLRLGEPARAFDFLERAKSRTLIDHLARNPEIRLRAGGAAPQELVDELACLREEHRWFYDRLHGYGLSRRPSELDEVVGDGPPVTEAATLRAAIREREVRIAHLLERLALHEAEWLGGVPASPTGAPLERPPLEPGDVLLEYYLAPDQGSVFILSGGELSVAPLAITSRALRRLLDRWRLNLAATAEALATGEPLGPLADNARELLRAFHEALLRPVVAHLTGCARLIVIPYGPAHEVPFHALVGDGGKFLLESLVVVTCPSSALLRLCAGRPRRARRSALILAHSDRDRLPFVREEARAVAALLPGERYLEGAATRSALASAAPDHAVLHLAAHGEARPDNPTFAHVKLADGQLSEADVCNLPLDGALVTLSACETGRGVVVGGDEVLGLARGFLYAGAATLVQSLWRVEDGATARLMARFYEGLRARRPAGIALRDAQLDQLDGWEGHPYFWAAFQLIGAGGPL